jgi:hypothetical protein
MNARSPKISPAPHAPERTPDTRIFVEVGFYDPSERIERVLHADLDSYLADLVRVNVALTAG